MQAHAIELDITAITPFADPQHVSATLFAPANPQAGAPVELVVGLPGGGYTRNYYHPQFDAPAGYSFAEYFAARGYWVLALDHYGTGASSRPADEARLSRGLIAEANDRLTRHVVAQIEAGHWTGGVATGAVTVTGVGHSMGGMMVIAQQGRFQTFQRVVVAGWTNFDLRIPGVPLELLRSHVQPAGYHETPRQLMRHFFYSADAPLPLIEADEAMGTVSSATMANDSVQAGIVRSEAEAIRCPLFLFYGDNEVTDEPAREVGFYPAARDITLVTMDGMAHIHNFEARRADWWDRLDRWIVSTPAGAP